MAQKATLTTSNPPLGEFDAVRDSLPPTMASDAIASGQALSRVPAWERSSVSNVAPSNVPEIKAPVIQSFETTPVESARVVESETMVEPVRGVPMSNVADVQTVELQQPKSPFEFEAVQTDSVFQGAVYGSFALICGLALFLTILLFRKASKVVEVRFVKSLNTLALALAAIALHAILSSGLFAVYWNQGGASMLLLVTIAIWVFVGPAVAVVLDHLLTPENAPRKATLVFDICAYAVIFACATISLVPAIHRNAAFACSLFSVFLFMVPFTRCSVVLRSARANHPELLKSSDRVLVYALLILPALLPIFVFGNACGLSHELTLFLFNFVTFNFILVVGFAMIASADDMTSSADADQPTNQTAKAIVTPVVPKPQPAAAGLTIPSRPMPGKLPAAQAKPNPPVKPDQRPVVSADGVKAANAPSSIKAPMKPKKRF